MQSFGAGGATGNKAGGPGSPPAVLRNQSIGLELRRGSKDLHGRSTPFPDVTDKTQQTHSSQRQACRFRDRLAENLDRVDGRSKIDRQGAESKTVARQACEHQVIAVIAVGSSRLDVGALESGIIQGEFGGTADRIISASASADGVAR